METIKTVLENFKVYFEQQAQSKGLNVRMYLCELIKNTEGVFVFLKEYYENERDQKLVLELSYMGFDASNITLNVYDTGQTILEILNTERSTVEMNSKIYLSLEVSRGFKVEVNELGEIRFLFEVTIKN